MTLNSIICTLLISLIVLHLSFSSPVADSSPSGDQTQLSSNRNESNAGIQLYSSNRESAQEQRDAIAAKGTKSPAEHYEFGVLVFAIVLVGILSVMVALGLFYLYCYLFAEDNEEEGSEREPRESLWSSVTSAISSIASKFGSSRRRRSRRAPRY